MCLCAGMCEMCVLCCVCVTVMCLAEKNKQLDILLSKKRCTPVMSVCYVFVCVCVRVRVQLFAWKATTGTLRLFIGLLTTERAHSSCTMGYCLCT
jgi:hypothetical protein